MNLLMGILSRAIPLDIWKTFDRIWFKGLPHTLASYAISRNVSSTIKSLLSDGFIKDVDGQKCWNIVSCWLASRTHSEKNTLPDLRSPKSHSTFIRWYSCTWYKHLQKYFEKHYRSIFFWFSLFQPGAQSNGRKKLLVVFNKS